MTANAEESPDDVLRALFARLDASDLGALEAVWDVCADDLFGLAVWRTGSRDDAEDALQDVFVALARARGLRRVRRPRAYLLTMAHRAAVRIARARRRGDVPADEADLVEPDDAAARVEARASVARLVASLPAAQREVVFLRHFAELSFRQIGAITGVPLFTAASRYRLAMRRLREHAGGAR